MLLGSQLFNFAINSCSHNAQVIWSFLQTTGFFLNKKIQLIVQGSLQTSLKVASTGFNFIIKNSHSVIEIFTRGIQKSISLVSNALQSFIEKTKNISTTLSTVTSHIGQLIIALIRKVFSTAIELKNKISSITASGLTNTYTNLISPLLNNLALLKAIPLKSYTLLRTYAQHGLNILKNGYMHFVSKILSVITFASNGSLNIFSNIKATTQQLSNSLSLNFFTLLSNTKTYLSLLISRFFSFFSIIPQSISSLKNLILNFSYNLGSFAQAAINSIINLFTITKTKISEALLRGLSLFSIIPQSLSSAKNRCLNFLKYLGSLAQSTIEYIGNSIKTIYSSFSTTINAVFSSITNSTRTLFNSIQDLTRSAGYKSLEKINTAKTISKATLSAGAGFVFVKTPTVIAAQVRGVITFLREAASNCINAINRSFSFVTNSLRNAIQTIALQISSAIVKTRMQLSFGIETIKAVTIQGVLSITQMSTKIALTLKNSLLSGLHVTQNFGSWLKSSSISAIILTWVCIVRAADSLYAGICISIKTIWSGIVKSVLGFLGLASAGARSTKNAAQRTTAYIAPKALLVGTLSKHALYGTAGFIFIKMPYGAFRVSQYLGARLQDGANWIALQLARAIKTFYKVLSAAYLQMVVVTNIILSPFHWAVSKTIEISNKLYNATLNTATQLLLVAQQIPNKVNVAILRSQRTIQKYALLAIMIYSGLTVFTTYHTAIINPSFEEIVHQKPLYPHATPIDIGFELKSLLPASTQYRGDFGGVTVEGILSYSYHAGSESSHDLDAISIRGSENHSIKKISSHINQNQIITTKQLIKAQLRTTPSDSTRFPFAPVKSTLTIQNDNLSAKNIQYQGTHTALSLSHEVQGLANIHIDTSTDKQFGYGNRKIIPEINIIFEHKGIATYTIIILYLLILGLTFLAIASFMINSYQYRLFSCLGALSGLSITWLVSYLQQLIPLMNHLGITLLVCMAITLIVLSITLSQNQTERQSPFAGQTRWMLGLLGILALFLTLLISL